MKQWIFLVVCLGLPFFGFAQTQLFEQSYGARSLGMGNIRMMIGDSWSILNHVGSLDRLEYSEVSIGLDQRFGIQELSTLSFSGAWKSKIGTAGIGISRFGGQAFNQQLLGLGFSNTLGIVSLGGRIDWFQTQIEGFGSGSAFLFSMGGVAELSPEFFLGANFSNLNQSRLSKSSELKLPTSIQLGVTYLPSDFLRISAELDKSIELPAQVRVGLESFLKPWLYLRTGIHSQPSRLHFGFGIRKNGWGLDYALGQQTALGSTHHLSLLLKWTE